MERIIICATKEGKTPPDLSRDLSFFLGTRSPSIPRTPRCLFSSTQSSNRDALGELAYGSPLSSVDSVGRPIMLRAYASPLASCMKARVVESVLTNGLRRSSNALAGPPWPPARCRVIVHQLHTIMSSVNPPLVLSYEGASRRWARPPWPEGVGLLRRSRLNWEMRHKPERPSRTSNALRKPDAAPPDARFFSFRYGCSKGRNTLSSGS